MRYLRLAAVYLRLGVFNELEYRGNLVVQVFQSLLGLGTALGGLAVVFSYTDNLGGWAPAELLGLLGVYFVVGGVINLVIQPSMQRLMEDVREGTLDFSLIKPADAQFLVSVRQFQLWRGVDLLIGLGLLGIALRDLGATLGPASALAFLVALAAGGVIVYSFWMMLSTLTFWVVRAENILVIFQSLYQAGRWPLSIYPSWLRYGLTFVVPVAFATSVPMEALSGRLSPAALAGAVVLAALLLWLCRRFWLRGLKHYSGASA
ncbi:MAG: ABC transporter permease [Anaerolineae bacterium]|nr:ABC transporter permease [Anaerolineae bacterium]